MLKDRLITQLIDSISTSAVNLGTGAILLLSASSQTGQLSLGDFALFVYYLGFVTVITSYSIHYTKLYDSNSTISPG